VDYVISLADLRKPATFQLPFLDSYSVTICECLVLCRRHCPCSVEKMCVFHFCLLMVKKNQEKKRPREAEEQEQEQASGENSDDDQKAKKCQVCRQAIQISF
jgi:hypothetical protein